MTGGCAPTPDYRGQLDKYLQNMVSRLDRELGPEAGDNLSAGPLSLTFRKACLRAALNDPNIMNSLAELQSRRLDVEQARSYVWPRLELQARAEAPLEGSWDDPDHTLTGGLFLRFDLWKAMFSSAEVQARQAGIKKTIEETRLALELIAHKLRLKLAQLDALEREVALRKKIAEDASQALKLMEAYGRMNRIDMAALWRSEAKADDSRARLREAEARLAAEQRSLARFLGLNGRQKFGVADTPEIFVADSVRAREDLSVSQVWARRGEARLAEMELLAAEVGVTLAEKGRLPRISASVGVGSIQLSSQDEEAASVVQLEFTLPLLDFGDNARRVAKARSARDLARRKVERLARHLWQEAGETAVGLSEVMARTDMVKDLLTRMRRQNELNQRLVDQRSIEPVEALSFRMELWEMEITYEKALLALKQAASAYRLSHGEPFAPGLADELFQDLLNEPPTDEGA